MNTIYQFNANNIEGNPVSLKEYQGKVLLIVNTASQCGFTSQYQELQALYDDLKEQNFCVLGFPCNQFGNQEPGDHQTIADFCQRNFAISFPMFEKLEVNGENTHPLYHFLKTSKPGTLGTTGIKWNFTKFLIRRDGTVYKRYGSLIQPKYIRPDIEKLLKA